MKCICKRFLLGWILLALTSPAPSKGGWLTSIWLSNQPGGDLGNQNLLGLDRGSGSMAPPATASPPASANQDDCQLLLKAKAEFANWEDFAEGNNVSGWHRNMASDILDCCSWTFITCNSAGQVSALAIDGDLLDVTLEGSLPATLAYLPQLMNLTIAHTELSGPLPCSSNGGFANLEYLVLSGNQLTGALPACYGSINYFNNLAILDLSSNSFSGALPSSWSWPDAFPRLQVMSLAYNQLLSGMLPQDWGIGGGFPSLEVLLLCGNNLTGTLPSQWSLGFAGLQKLDMSSNALQGQLPAAWGSRTAFQALTGLQLSNNLLAGTLPDAEYAQPDSWPRLQQLDLSGNNFTGSLPALWSTTGMPLSSLSLARNQLTGSFPDSWSQPGVWNELQKLNLSQNQLSGSLPSTWAYNGKFAQLVWLDITNNSLTGQLPGSWRGTVGAWPQLLSARLGTNSLTGTLPDDWANNTGMRQLTTLDLSSNAFAGGLPASWARGSSFDYLRELILTSSGLGGGLPASWADRGAFPLLRILQLANNSFDGPIPASWGGFLATVWLKPGNDRLCGPFPPQMLVCQASSACSPSANASCPCAVPAPNPQCSDSQAGSPEAASAPQHQMPSSLAVTLRLTPLQSSNFSNELQLRLVEAVQSFLPPQISVLLSSIQDLETNSTDARRRRLLSRFARRLAAVEGPVPARAVAGAASSIPSSAPAIAAPQLDSLAASAPEAAVSVTFHSVNVTLFVAAPDSLSALKAARNLLNVTATSDMLNALRQRGFTTLKAVQLIATDTMNTPPPFPQPDLSHDKYPQQAPSVPIDSDDTGLSTGKIAAAVVSSVVGATCLTAAACLFWQRRRKWLISGNLGLDKTTLKTASSIQRDSDGSPKATAWPIARIANPLLAVSQTSVDTIPTKRTGSELKLPWSDWQAQPDEYSIVVTGDGKPWELGRGNFGIVYRGLRNSVCPVAIKVMKDVPSGANSSLTEKRRTRYLEEFKREILLLKACRDKNIVQFVGASVAEGRPMLVTEFMEQGDLFRALEADDADRRRFSWYGARRRPDGSRIVNGLSKRVALDVARGLAFLHSRNIVHFDLKSANILLARDFTAKLTDVGLAKILSKEYITTMTGSVGTFAWTAPEILLGKENICEKADLFSMGVVLWELCTGEAPLSRALRQVKVPDEAPQAVVDLMFACRHEDPHARPSAIELVKRIEALQ